MHVLSPSLGRTSLYLYSCSIPTFDFSVPIRPYYRASRLGFRSYVYYDVNRTIKLIFDHISTFVSQTFTFSIVIYPSIYSSTIRTVRLTIVCRQKLSCNISSTTPDGCVHVTVQFQSAAIIHDPQSRTTLCA